MIPSVSLEEMNQIVIELGDLTFVCGSHVRPIENRIARLQLALAEWKTIGIQLADFLDTMNKWLANGKNAGLPSLLKKWPTTC